ncbi:hypothetical protein [Pseudofrankia sp. BMG5.36]|uniref:hypothetical protein n=1 Tax=Pseudofrankia sp. BMG5.36 TaxID=1834512 RepID=UPI0008D94AE1|nr:hypothetical protein [Pseudofrankia sp. BMG5.36]OHV65575.1 hypothetical protein BCD48_36575 [Pseudofrankia sp. BMG5.36]
MAGSGFVGYRPATVNSSRVKGARPQLSVGRISGTVVVSRSSIGLASVEPTDVTRHHLRLLPDHYRQGC